MKTKRLTSDSVSRAKSQGKAVSPPGQSRSRSRGPSPLKLSRKETPMLLANSPISTASQSSHKTMPLAGAVKVLPGMLVMDLGGPGEPGIGRVVYVGRNAVAVTVEGVWTNPRGDLVLIDNELLAICPQLPHQNDSPADETAQDLFPPAPRPDWRSSRELLPYLQRIATANGVSLPKSSAQRSWAISRRMMRTTSPRRSPYSTNGAGTKPNLCTSPTVTPATSKQR